MDTCLLFLSYRLIITPVVLLVASADGTVEGTAVPAATVDPGHIY
jgi:hypothetical protein